MIKITIDNLKNLVSSFNDEMSMNKIYGNFPYLNIFSKKVGYIGWLGFGNVGDEALYQAARMLFRKLSILPYKHSGRIRAYEQLIKKRLFNAIILGGGTLINTKGYLTEFKMALKSYDAIYVFGTGVRNPIFWDRVDGNNNYLNEWIECLKKCRYVGVRGPLSQQILRNNGFTNADIIGDPALFLAREKIKRKPHKKRLGINIGVSNGRVWGKEDSILDFVIKFSKIMIEKGWDITFIPVWDGDVDYTKDAARKIGKPVSIFYGNNNSIKKNLDILETFDIFVGEKLHSVVLAMCVYTPAIMLEYRPKCLDFMTSMNLEKFNIRTNNLSLDLLMSLIGEIYGNSYCLQDEIFKKVNYYKCILKEKAVFIEEQILKNYNTKIDQRLSGDK